MPRSAYTDRDTRPHWRAVARSAQRARWVDL